MKAYQTSKTKAGRAGIVNARPPVFTVAPTTASVSAYGAIQFTATTSGGGTITYSLVTYPAGTTINASTGLVTLGSTSGTVTVRASASGLTADASCAVTVNDQVNGTFTITGSGFGTRSQLAPLFYRFFAPGEIADNVSPTVYGYSGSWGARTYTADGYVPGCGSIGYDSALGDTAAFPHIYYVPAVGQFQIFQSCVVKIVRTAGSVNDYTARVQLKGMRYTYGAEYTGVPAIKHSEYPSADGLSYLYTNVSAGIASGEVAADDTGLSPAYISRFRSGGWNTVENFVSFGTVGNADGFSRIWYNGAAITPLSHGDPYAFNTEAIPLRTSSAQRIEYISLHPGIDFPGGSGNVYSVRLAEHVIDTTQARVVVGNAATWGACTQRQYMIPTAWSDTSVTANWRPLGFATSGQTVYGYVVNADGTISAATTLTVP